MDVLCIFKILIERKNLEHGCTKTSDHMQIKIKLQNPNQEPPVPNQDLKDMHVFCTFTIKIESPHLEHGFIKDQ